MTPGELIRLVENGREEEDKVIFEEKCGKLTRRGQNLHNLPNAKQMFHFLIFVQNPGNERDLWGLGIDVLFTFRQHQQIPLNWRI